MLLTLLSCKPAFQIFFSFSIFYQSNTWLIQVENISDKILVKINRSFASCNAVFFSFSRYDISWLLTKWKNMPERAMHFPKKETWKYYNIIWNSAPCCYVISCFPFYIFFIFFSFMEKKASIFIAYIENCSSVSVDNAI